MPSNSMVASPAIDAARLAWRRGLREMECRELATEYQGALHRAGGNAALVDIMLVDANDEYMERYYEADQLLGRDRRKIKKRNAGKDRKKALAKNGSTPAFAIDPTV